MLEQIGNLFDVCVLIEVEIKTKRQAFKSQVIVVVFSPVVLVNDCRFARFGVLKKLSVYFDILQQIVLAAKDVVLA